MTSETFREKAFYMRNPDWIAVGRNRGLNFFRDGQSVEIGDDAQSLSGLLQLLTFPRLGSELLHATRSSVKMKAMVERDFATLLNQGIINEGETAEGLLSCFGEVFFPKTSAKPCKHLVVGITGSIQASGVAPLLRTLANHFCDQLDVVFTETALKFLHRDVVRHMGLRTWGSMHEVQGDINVPHVQLARSADLVLVLPASANFIYRLASGSCSDLLSLICTGTVSPVVLVPGTNEALWSQPAVSRNVQQLREDGFYLVEQSHGLVWSSSKAKPVIGYGGTGFRPTRPETLSPILEKILKEHPRAVPKD